MLSEWPHSVNHQTLATAALHYTALGSHTEGWPIVKSCSSLRKCSLILNCLCSAGCHVSTRAHCTYCEHQRAPLTRAMNAQHASLHTSLEHLFSEFRPGLKKSVVNVLRRNSVRWSFIMATEASGASSHLMDVVFYFGRVSSGPHHFRVNKWRTAGLCQH